MCTNIGKGDFIRIVVDTNILISSIFWRGNPYRILKKCFEKKVKLVISKEILDEVGRILIREKKFRLNKDDVLLYTEILLNNSELVN
ncbi:MAG: putative toxin-antitoxin system toxin component, PIN family [Euryarchaeota archaeon]|nr:putative toxin-antitoxin system toxin component, PIN family [Euryarchaeota archaeon]